VYNTKHYDNTTHTSEDNTLPLNGPISHLYILTL